jgi:hypothetical protein
MAGLISFFSFGCFMQYHHFDEIVLPVMTAFSSMPEPMFDIFKSWLICLPELFVRIVNCFQSILGRYCYAHPDSMHGYRSNPLSILLTAATRLYSVNQLRPRPLGFSAFANALFTDCFSPEIEARSQIVTNPANKDATSEIFPKHPYLFTLEFKSSICRFESAVQFQQEAIESLQRNRGSPQQIMLEISVRRTHLVDDAVRELLGKSPRDLNKSLVVKFAGEQAFDAGGVSREFFYLLTTSIFSPDYGLFRQIQNVYWFTTNKFAESNRCRLLGVLAGLSIRNGIVLPIRFPLLLYKKLRAFESFGLEDLAEIEPEVVKSFTTLLSEEGRATVADAGLTFSRDVDELGHTETYDLVTNGRNVAVTAENLEAYIAKYIEWAVITSVQDKYGEFEKGFKTVCSLPIYNYITYDEFDILLSGEEVIDWDELKWGVKYIGYTAESRTIEIFWQIFDGYTDDDKRRFLVFVTGTDKVPIGGLATLQIHIERETATDRLPIAHTCTSHLALPDYEDEGVMRRNLAKCLEYCEGFGFI